MRLQHHQKDLLLTVNSVAAWLTLDVSYIWVPHDTDASQQVEILSVRVRDTYDITHLLPTEIMQEITREIEVTE